MLATAGRPPTVDLPQHAVTLRRLLDGPSDIFAIRWSAPYSVFFVIASVFAMVTDAARAVWLTMALTIALMPVAGAALAAALRRTPLLGCFALLGAFTTVTGWGFLPLVLGAVMVTFVFAAALHYAHQPGTRRAILLAGLLAAVYSTHMVAWVIAVPLSMAVVVTRLRPFSVRALWPLVVGGGWGGLLCWRWLSGLVKGEALARQPDYLPGHPWRQKLGDLIETSTLFGRQEPLATPWTLLGLVAIVGVIGCVMIAARDGARARREKAPGASPGAAKTASKKTTSASKRSKRRRGGRSAAAGKKARAAGAAGDASSSAGVSDGGSLQATTWYRLRDVIAGVVPVVAPVGAFVCFLLTPTTWFQTFLVYPRFLVITAVFLPAAFIGVAPRWTRLIAWPGVILALILVYQARGEVVQYQEMTACMDELGDKVRPGESLKAVRLLGRPEGYHQPVFAHVVSDVTARRGGFSDYEFADNGTSVVTYQPGVRRSSLTWGRERGELGEYTAWLIVHPKVTEVNDVKKAYLYGHDVTIERCGEFILATEEAVEPGSKKARRRLPHRSAAR